jgi:DNA-binding GntR family transcriptional regulator
MRVVYGRYGTANMIDQHQAATNAIAASDPAAVEAAIRADIGDFSSLMADWDLLQL